MAIQGPRTSCEDVLKTDIKRGVGMGSECISVFAIDVLWPAIVVAHSVADLGKCLLAALSRTAPNSPNQTPSKGSHIHAYSASVHRPYVRPQWP